MFHVEPSHLSDQLKALDHQVDHGADAPFPKSNFLYLIVGGVGSGKTSIALRLLQIPTEEGGFRKAFHHIFVVSPTAKYDPKWNKLIDEIDDQGQYYQECDDETMGEIMARIEELNEERAAKKSGRRQGGPSNLVIIDDCVDAFSQKKRSKLLKLILTLRHLKTTVIIMSQKLNAIPTLIRAQARCISFFPSLNRREEATFINEINIDEDLFKRLIHFAGVGADHPFLHVKLGQGKPIFFRKFNRILL
jgi:hypothetical protein